VLRRRLIREAILESDAVDEEEEAVVKDAKAVQAQTGTKSGSVVPMPLRGLQRIIEIADETRALVAAETHERADLEREWGSATAELERLKGHHAELEARLAGTQKHASALEVERNQVLAREKTLIAKLAASEQALATAKAAPGLQAEVDRLKAQVEMLGAFCPHCGKRRLS
jgi:chromosome segregation ATPase